MMLTMMKNESELKAMVNLEMLLVHVRVRDAGQRHKRLLHSLKYFRRIFFKFTRFVFLQSKICICAKQDLHFCKTRFAFVQSKICSVQNKICVFAKQDLYFCKTRFVFLQDNIRFCAKQYLHLCKTRSAFATHLWTCPLEHVVRSSSLVVGSGQAAMFRNHFCNCFVWICF